MDTATNFTIALSETPSREVMASLEDAAARCGCVLTWTELGLEVASPAADLLLDCFLMALAQALPLIQPHWAIQSEAIGMAA
jgi:hypothetical protein